jgi:integrase
VICPPRTSIGVLPRRQAASAHAQCRTSNQSCAAPSPALKPGTRSNATVVLLCETPSGQAGRPSKALTLPQAHALVEHASGSTMGAYVLLSLLTGARTEELQALTWSHVDLDGNPRAKPPVPPHMTVWHSVRTGDDTKTRSSRRTLALPQRCVDALRELRRRQATQRALAEQRWTDHDLVVASEVGTRLDAANVRRGFRRVATAAGLDAKNWTSRELRHSFCPCCPTRACRSNRSPASSATPAGQRSPRPSTPSSCGPSSTRARPSWMRSSPSAGVVTQLDTHLAPERANGPVLSSARSS